MDHNESIPPVDSHPLGIVAADGRILAADLYRPRDTLRAQVVIHGATAVPRTHYAPFARFLASAGYETLIYDYRGVGGSALGHAREDRATMSDWLMLDAPAAVRRLRAEDPGVPFFAVGHSFGGQSVAALADVEAPDAIATMGAQRGYWATFPMTVRPRMALNWFVLLPALTGTLGYLPAKAGLGVDMPAGIVDEWARWCRHPDYFLGDHPELAGRMAAYRGRLLALSVTDDDFAPLANVTWLLERHQRAVVDHVRFAPSDVGATRFGHFGFFRTQHAERVWPEVLGHFEESLGSGPRPRRLGASVATTRRPRVLLDERELLLDLEYGRA